ncbi:glycoside hydrolase family protein [Erwinia sp. BNK-24-b]|uniref:glycoside hydrolase family protein n=1 Tax=Erwinia TaxID=551 RepID=UPI001FEEF46B|nr:lysozyme [Erwinia phyllosphaerae]MBV4366367.1 lysozyme [Erwinia phyllosphaerae]
MSKIIQILAFEEGYKEKPYIDTEGYPTVGCGILLGPKNAPLQNYNFTVPREVGDVWMGKLVDAKIKEMNNRPVLVAALKQCNDARADVLYSMAYQLGIDGLCAFKNTLVMISNNNFTGAAEGMLSSVWAKQTPERAKRHADAMRSGTYDAWKGAI